MAIIDYCFWHVYTISLALNIRLNYTCIVTYSSIVDSLTRLHGIVTHRSKNKRGYRIGKEIIDLLIPTENKETCALKDVAKILYAATKKIDETLNGPSGPGKNPSG